MSSRRTSSCKEPSDCSIWTSGAKCRSGSSRWSPTWSVRLVPVPRLTTSPAPPPVVNDANVINKIEAAATDALGADNVVHTHQSLGAEDFAWYLEDIPGALIRLGAALPNRRVDLHSASFDIDESAIETGILVATATILRLLAEA